MELAHQNRQGRAPDHKIGGRSPEDDFKLSKEEKRILKMLTPKRFPLGPTHQVAFDPELALKSYLRARRFEIMSPSIKRKGTSTYKKYASDLDTLRGKSDDGTLETPCPFIGFMNADFSGMSKNTFYRYKAALQSYAVDLLMKAGPGMLHTLAKKENKAAVANSLQKEFNVDKNLGTTLTSLKKRPNVDKGQNPYIHYVNVDNLDLKRSIWAFEDLYDQTLKAASFLDFYRPLEEEKSKHLNKTVRLLEDEDGGPTSTLRLQNQQHVRYKRAFMAPGFFVFNPEFKAAQKAVHQNPAAADDRNLKIIKKYENRHALGMDTDRRVNTKGYVVSELKRYDARLADGMEWRQRFFQSLENLPDSKREDRQKQVAILTLTGCRPSEFVKGIRVHVENGKPNSKSVGLVFKIMGAKFTTHPQADEISIYETLTANEKKYQVELYKDGSFETSLEKGHEWRYIRIVSEAPEALWLRDYVMREADGHADRPAEMEDMGLAEQRAFSDILEEDAVASITIRPDFVEEKKLDTSYVSEDNRKAVHNMGRWIYYHACKVFPTLSSSVTPYSWRHQFASDVKLFAHDLENNALDTRAEALGQASQRTQSRYGQRRSGRSPSRGGKFNNITFRTSGAVRKNFKQALISRPSPKL